MDFYRNSILRQLLFDGMITSSATQTVNGDKDLIIDQIYVTKGDAVKKGDPLISFDTTLVEMELNIAKLKRQKLKPGF